MATITYVAKRRLEKTGYKKLGTDISAAPADDSFNAASTILTGLLADQWVQTTGFANAANNGFFQAKADATSGKILQVTPPMAHLRLPGVANNFASTPDSAANSVTGNIELMARAALTSWAPAANMVFIGKDDVSANRDYGLWMDSASSGKLVFFYSPDGTTTRFAVSTVAVPFAALAIGYVKATYNTGTGVVQFFTSTDGVAFTQLGTNVTITAGTIHDGTSTLTVGGRSDGTLFLGGRVYYAEVRNGIGGTIVAAFDASRGVRNATTVVAATGETWTINTSGTPPTLLQGLALVTEAAGPVIALTGYKRGLGQSYQMEFVLSRADRSNQVKRTMQMPMDDTAPEVILYHEENYDDLQTSVITEPQLAQWREFLSSVSAGELFTYDKYGSIAVPDNPLSAMLSSTSYSEPRETGVYIGGNFVYRIPFQVRVFV
jgi:hypothetical protein